MATLKKYIEEYRNTCDVILDQLKKNEDIKKIHKLPKNEKWVAIDRDLFEKILLKNNYDSIKNKMKIWKDFNWLKTDENRYTKNVKIAGKCQKKIVINIQPKYHLEKIPYYENEG